MIVWSNLLGASLLIVRNPSPTTQQILCSARPVASLALLSHAYSAYCCDVSWSFIRTYIILGFAHSLSSSQPVGNWNAVYHSNTGFTFMRRRALNQVIRWGRDAPKCFLIRKHTQSMPLIWWIRRSLVGHLFGLGNLSRLPFLLALLKSKSGKVRQTDCRAEI